MAFLQRFVPAICVMAVAVFPAACRGGEPPAADAAVPTRVVVAPRHGESDTDAIQRTIDSGADEVVIPFVARSWVIRPVRLRDGLTLRFEPGVRVEAAPGAYRGKTDSMFVGHEVKNVRLIGYGATLRMRQADYVTSGYERGEWRNGIDLRGAQHVSIEGLTITETGGDGVYVGPTWDHRRIPCRHIVVRDCTMDRNYRQGLTIISGEDVKVENCAFRRTGGTNPQAGIDLEPANARDSIMAIHIKNCVSSGNVGSGVIVALPRLTSKSRPVSVVIENCLFRDSKSHLVQVSIGKDAPQGTVLFQRCVFEDSPRAGLRGVWKSAPDEFSVRFEDCTWSRVARSYRRGPIALDLATVERPSKDGGIFFEDSCVMDDGDRPVMDEGAAGRSDIKGRLWVVNPKSTTKRVRHPSQRFQINYVDSTAAITQSMKNPSSVDHSPGD